jgi:hypothetical protein
MARAPSTPAARLRHFAELEFRALLRDLGMAQARSKDAAVHRARKSIQRLRAVVRLVAPADPAWARREDLALRRLRRRLGALRDAAVRVDLVQSLGSRELIDGERDRLDAALGVLRGALAARWQQHAPDSPFWASMLRQATRMQSRLPRWPLDAIDERCARRAMERARRRLRQALQGALGRTQRNHRHDLRRRLRRYASLRKIAALAFRRRDSGVNLLTDLAREMGAEGDLWMAAAALRSTGHAHETRALRKLLEDERRLACKRHDGELAAVRRRFLCKPPRLPKPAPDATGEAIGSAGSMAAAPAPA